MSRDITDTPLDRIRTLTAELQQVYQSLAAAGQGPPPGQEAPPLPSEDDVIDADFTTGE